MFTTHSEDVHLRKESWTNIFLSAKEIRPIEHDTAKVDLPQPSDPALQCAWYSHYYTGCIAKGSVAVQFCGWTIAFDLYTGGMSDTAYVKAVNILAMQEEFAKNDPSSPNPFLNIFDRGYCLTHDAVCHGGQSTLQPIFAWSDRRFNSKDVLSSAGVATVCSGNERSVHQVKLSWLI